jgi:alcohol dehydrogenase class IV
MKENKDDYLNKLIADAAKLLNKYFKENFTFGLGCLDTVGRYILEFGKSTLLIISKNHWAKPLHEKIINILKKDKICVISEVPTAAPNAPFEDVTVLSEVIKKVNPESITCVGGGSAIDCAKAANVLASLGENTSDLGLFFGLGEVTKISKEKNKKLYPLIAVMVAAGSASHLTKHSNVTFFKSGQKKVMSDDMIIPDRAVFDYSTTLTTPLSLTLDGAMDGLSHCLEVYYSISPEKNGEEDFVKVEKACLTAISLIIEVLPCLTNDLKNLKYRQAIGLATDLGGYALMKGWTNLPHINSFGVVDIISHGRACGILNPYYTVFFATAIREKLVRLLKIFKDYIDEITLKHYKEFRNGFDDISSRVLGEIAAKAMINFASKLGLPTRLNQIKSFSDNHIDRMVSIAKSPKFENRLKNMPISLDGLVVDKYVLPVILAAKSGDFSLIQEVK